MRMKDILENKNAVIFDLDGTLVDSMWIWKAIDIEYLGRYGISLPDDLQKSIEGMGFSETAHYFKERFQIPDSIEEIKSTWNHMARHVYESRVPLKEGAFAFLNYLKGKNFKIGIATSNSRELVTIILKKHNILNIFDTVVTSCDVAAGKPSPDIYLKAAKDMNVTANKCLVFEDVPMGILAGKNANMTVCAVEDEFSKKMVDEKRQLADYYINTYLELI